MWGDRCTSPQRVGQRRAIQAVPDWRKRDRKVVPKNHLATVATLETDIADMACGGQLPDRCSWLTRPERQRCRPCLKQDLGSRERARAAGHQPGRGSSEGSSQPGQNLASVRFENPRFHGAIRTTPRWISPAIVPTWRVPPSGHFFAANRRAHAISPPLAASRPVLMQIYAGVAELVDALDLGSSDESCGGSSPSARTKRFQRLHGLPRGLLLADVFPYGAGSD